MIRKLILVTLIITALLLLLGCNGATGTDPEAVPEQEENNETTEPPNPEETDETEGQDEADVDSSTADQLPEDIQAWIESSKQYLQGQTKSVNGKLYILVTYGEKPTGGYTVEITDTEVKEDELLVTAEFTEPGPDEIVTQALTYPYDLVVIDDPGLLVKFIATGAESDIPMLK